MSLSGAQFEQLRDALCDAFDLNSLAEMVRFRLGERLDHIVAVSNTTMQKITSDLIGVFEQRGTTDELIRAAYKTRPKNPKLLKYCQQHAQFVFEPPKLPEEAVKSVGAGLIALAGVIERLGPGRVLQIIQGFRYDFQVTRDRITKLAKYKALHDCLHELDFQYYRELESAVANFRKDDTYAEQLDAYTSDLSHKVQQARENAEGLPSCQVEIGWIKQFDQAVAVLRQALDGPDDVPTQGALQMLKYVLPEAARINGLLASIAGDLRLQELIEAMRQVRDATGQSAPQDGFLLLQEFQTGLKDLEGLQSHLMGCIEEHWHWQGIDKDLRLADANASQSLDDVLVMWPFVLHAVQSLCNVSRETPWAEELQSLADRVDAASAAKNPVELRRTFRRFRRVAMRRFFYLDVELKDLCDKLVLIGGPLDMVLRVITHGDN
jgi:hypothetical protein